MSACILPILNYEHELFAIYKIAVSTNASSIYLSSLMIIPMFNA